MTYEPITPLHVWSGYSPLRSPQPLERLVRRAAEVGHALLALTGLGLLLRSLMLTAYALGLAFAFARDAVALEEPQLPR